MHVILHFYVTVDAKYAILLQWSSGIWGLGQKKIQQYEQLAYFTDSTKNRIATIMTFSLRIGRLLCRQYRPNNFSVDTKWVSYFSLSLSPLATCYDSYLFLSEKQS